MLCLSGFELNSSWVPLKIQEKRFLLQRFVMSIVGLYHVRDVQYSARTSGAYMTCMNNNLILPACCNL